VSPLLFVLVAIVLVCGTLVWVGALVDAAQYDDTAFTAVGRVKRGTVVLLVLTWAFGGAWYWARLKPRLRRLP